MLAAAAAAWPDGQPSAAQLRFEPGRLSLPGASWALPQVDALRQRLAALGWGLDQRDGQLVIYKPSPGALPTNAATHGPTNLPNNASTSAPATAPARS